MKTIYNRIILFAIALILIFSFGCKTDEGNKDEEMLQMAALAMLLQQKPEFKLISVETEDSELELGHTHKYSVTMYSNYRVENVPLEFLFYKSEDLQDEESYFPQESDDFDFIVASNNIYIPVVEGGENTYEVEIMTDSDISYSGNYQTLVIIDPREIFEEKGANYAIEKSLWKEVTANDSYKDIPDIAIENIDLDEDFFVLPFSKNSNSIAGTIDIKSIAQNYKNAKISFRLVGPYGVEQQLIVWDSEIRGFTDKLIIPYIRNYLPLTTVFDLSLDESNITSFIESYSISGEEPTEFTLVASIEENGITSTIDLYKKRSVSATISFIKDSTSTNGIYTQAQLRGASTKATTSSTNSFHLKEGGYSKNFDSNKYIGSYISVLGSAGLSEERGGYVKGEGIFSAKIMKKKIDIFNGFVELRASPHKEHIGGNASFKLFGWENYKAKVEGDQEFGIKDWSREFDTPEAFATVTYAGFHATAGGRGQGKVGFAINAFVRQEDYAVGINAGPYIEGTVFPFAEAGFSVFAGGVEGEVQLVKVSYLNEANVSVSYKEETTERSLIAAIKYKTYIELNTLAGKIKIYGRIGSRWNPIKIKISFTLISFNGWGRKWTLYSKNIADASVSLATKTNMEKVTFRPKHKPYYCMTNNDSKNCNWEHLGLPCIWTVKLRLQNCWNSNSKQSFKIQYEGSKYFRIVTYRNLCFLQEDRGLTQDKCTTYEDKGLFEKIDRGNGYYSIHNKQTGKVFSVTNDHYGDMSLEKWHGSPKQQFKFE